MTVNEYLESIPEQFRGVLSEGVRLQETRKQELVKAITANTRNKFSAEDLGQKPVSELEMIASLAVTPDFTMNGEPATNQGATVVEEPMPEITFGTKKEN